MGVQGGWTPALTEGAGPVLSATEERCFLACFRIRPPGLRSCQAALPKPSGRVFGGVFRCRRRVFWLLGPGLANLSFLIDLFSVLPILAVPTTCSFGTWSSIVSSFHGKGAWRRMRCACRKLCFGFGAAFTLSGRLGEGNRNPKW